MVYYIVAWLHIQYILTHYIDSSNWGQSPRPSYVIHHTVVPSYHWVFLFWLKTFQIRWSHFAIWEVWNPIDKISFLNLKRWPVKVGAYCPFYCLVDWILKSEQSRVRVPKNPGIQPTHPSGKPCEFWYIQNETPKNFLATFCLVWRLEPKISL